MTRPVPNRNHDAGLEAHRAAVAHLHACADAMFAEEEDAAVDAGSPAVGPYCGCTDCDVRETLAAAWPILLVDAARIVDVAGHGSAAELLRTEALRFNAVLATPPSPSYTRNAAASPDEQP
ncbi:hypothetical protein AB0M46_00325 [Dactylosporangium sp. NPDC051485]|uniref:hypothetical protein n=1 Tax=Dactylosporangium sp. NPDC051485 TaxID=3154846 RepID=UPI0034127C61